MALLLPARLRLLQVGLVGAALTLGVLAGVKPAYALLALVGAGFALVILSDMAVGLCLFTLITFIDTIPNPLGTLSMVKLVGLLVAMSWLANIASGQNRRSFVGRFPLAGALFLAILAWMAASALWAESLSAWADAAQTWTLNLALFPILFMGLRKPKDVSWLLLSFVVGVLLSVIDGVLTGTAAGVDNRLGGAAGINPNILGDLSAVGAILAVTLALQRTWPTVTRLAMLVAAGFSVVTVFLTGSREAVLGLAVAILVSPLLVGRGRRGGMLLGAATAAMVAVVLFLAFTPASVRTRLFSADATGSGRTNIWLVGLRMVKAHPVQGIGAGNFPITTIHYLFAPGELQFSKYIVDEPKVAHNIYLEVLAELGIVGLVMLLVLLGFCLSCSLRAANLFARQGDGSSEVMARGLLIALIALL